MDALGEKIHSKKLAMDAGVRTVPGYVGDVPNAEEAGAHRERWATPIMIKASSGGGGKGMRIAYSERGARAGGAGPRARA